MTREELVQILTARFGLSRPDARLIVDGHAELGDGETSMRLAIVEH